MIKNIFSRALLFLAFFLPSGHIIRPALHRLRGVKIGKKVWISKYVYIDENHPECISIGDNSTIGLRTTIFAHTYFGKRQKNNPDHVVIGKNVFIGPHCLILANVTIGDNAVIKGGTTITRNIPPNTMWGTPSPEQIANVTVPLTPDYTYQEFMRGLRSVKRNGHKKSNTKT